MIGLLLGGPSKGKLEAKDLKLALLLHSLASGLLGNSGIRLSAPSDRAEALATKRRRCTLMLIATPSIPAHKH